MALQLQIQKDKDLAPLTTFKVGGKAKEFVEITSKEQLPNLYNYLKEIKIPFFILSGGSNVVISDQGFDGIVIYMDIKGKELVADSNDEVKIQVYGGENWDAFVKECVDKKYWGIENLSHVPGKVGSAPVQNIGAYGQEVSNTVESVNVFDLDTGLFITLSNNECEFSYRNSIFKKNKNYLIVSVTFKLSKKPKPNLSYKDLSIKFAGNENPSIKDIREEVIKIRNTKFPFPTEKKGGNVGSFFKNVEMVKSRLDSIEEKIKTTLGEEKASFLKSKVIEVDENKVKIPSAVLLDISGLKNFKIGGAYVNTPQPLVLLNDGTASSKDVFDLSSHIIKVVNDNSGIALEREPELIGKFPG